MVDKNIGGGTNQNIGGGRKWCMMKLDVLLVLLVLLRRLF